VCDRRKRERERKRCERCERRRVERGAMPQWTQQNERERERTREQERERASRYLCCKREEPVALVRFISSKDWSIKFNTCGCII
jgi:hypothetical protein